MMLLNFIRTCLFVFCMVRIGWCSPVGEWELWKLKYNKVYNSQDDEESHIQTWEENYKHVEIHNQQPDKMFILEMNFLADQTYETIPDCNLLFTKQLSRTPIDVTRNEDVLYVDHQDEMTFLPSSWDWRTKGAISPVEYQLQGDALAIVVKESVESFGFINNGKLQLLSVQEVHDCCTMDFMQVSKVFQCIHNIGGLCTESDYPLSKDQCMNTTCTSAVEISGGKMVPQGNETAMKAVVYHTPVMALIDASHVSFQMYSSGIYSEEKCSDIVLDHPLQVVGYGTMNTQDYWICKNNWGPNWGMNGYLLLARNKGNMCGIASQTRYPV